MNGQELMSALKFQQQAVFGENVAQGFLKYQALVFNFDHVLVNGGDAAQLQFAH